MNKVLGGLAFLGCLVLVPLVVILVAAADNNPKPALDLPEEGDDLLQWAAANPGRTTCPDSPEDEL